MISPRFALLLAIALASATGAAADYVRIAGGQLRTALPTDGPSVAVTSFRMRSQPVSNGEFAAFLKKHPQWQRGKVPALFAGPRYLSQWQSASNFAPLHANAPVTAVSWHAAQAYCDSEAARLPTWYEWELAAAADEKRRDARDDPAWRARILSWYEQPAAQNLPPIGRHTPNAYGLHDMHQLIWEWVEDFNGLFVTSDARNQGEQKLLETCGAAALSLGDRDNYAVLMRVALLSSLDGRDTVESLGFRCARND